MGSKRRLPRWLSAPRKAASWLVTSLAALLLVAFIGWMTVPRILNVQALIVLTGSMEPALPVGSVAFVQKSGDAAVETGDIITFYRPEAAQRVLVTHRVIEVVETEDGEAYKTQGDANDEPDAWLVPGQLVVGEVGIVIPHMGHVTERIRGRNGFLALMAIPGALIILGEIGKIRQELRILRKRGSPA